jgi:hypothetical protein
MLPATGRGHRWAAVQCTPCMKHASFVLFAVLACGQPKATSTPPHAHDEAHDHDELPAEVKSFHEVLAPRWHADKGDARTQDTCGAVAEFEAKAAAIAALTTPAGGDAGHWSTSTKELGDAVAALETACQGADPAAFEPAFHRVHEGFHAVMEAAGAKPHAEG